MIVVVWQLPRKEFLLDGQQRRQALCGLVDLLFAYAYDVRTTDGEPTVESGWTIRHLSSLLSWLDQFVSVTEVALVAIHRSMCFPLVRNYRLSVAILADVVTLLKSGRSAVLRALLDIRQHLQRGLDHGSAHATEPKHTIAWSVAYAA